MQTTTIPNENARTIEANEPRPMTNGWKILLVDDDEAGREAMGEWLERRGYSTVLASDGSEAIQLMGSDTAVIVTDLRMPKTDGLQLLDAAKEKAPHAAVILVSGHGTVDTAVSALKAGAYDFLTKPINLEELTHRVENAMTKVELEAEVQSLHAQLTEKTSVHEMLGSSQKMTMLFEKIKLVADTRTTVLITGESGTGKELVARALHHHSGRSSGPFVPINCAALPENLVESELFGHVPGAFTGALGSDGLFRAAHGGTLFVDEVGELPLAVQAKLLRAIETKRVIPVGGTKEVEIDVRLVGATHRNMAEEVAEKRFREDLYYRLKVVELEIPPLRERREDIPILIRHFLDELAAENQREPKSLTADVLDALKRYDWPGNVRDLRNTLEGIVVLTPGDTIELDNLPENLRKRSVPASGTIDLDLTLDELEEQAIRQAVAKYSSRDEVAAALGVSVRTIQRKIQKYGIE